MKRQLVWLRSDLRLRDNSALHAAAERGPVIALYLLSPGQWQRHDDAPSKVDFWLRNLRELRASLDELHIPLLIRTADLWDEAPKVIAQLCRELNIETLHVNEEYGVNEAARDAAVEKALEHDGVRLRSHLDQLFFTPGTILTKGGTYFQVYSQFRKVCYERLNLGVPSLLPAPRAQQRLDIPGDAVPAQVEGFEPAPPQLREEWPAGEDAAHERIELFTDEILKTYQDTRDLPARDGTSRLSPYLAAGVISPRQCLHAALANNHGEFETGNSGAVSWINELLWREFYKHILVGFPRVSRHRAFREDTEKLKWRYDQKDLQDWQQGRTGFPIIDAAMRQLLATGWMHNRLRMVVAMFLTKNLLIDWREGERWFMRHLIDGDLAANNGGWQWSASTGTDAAPYFRIFNPISQSERFDPDGRFIRRWVPELAGLQGRAMHDPSKLGLFGVEGYPQPMCDLSATRERALEAFKSLSAAR
ncbi:deoxyribodipyrimidine photo-lyase [Pseudomonas sp. GD04087]|uniref:deoxyribodipyrimidine photo-lyase n=1 Tax=unclassified Pseudomonas TaxID=196821 RepID=UPI0024476C95|nr:MULTISPECIES: deoxyribodipyrimidine photo-lyase [unclassified Pseudomonas]MDH0293006.1 deoxyribodipyrimidine photo-lyase [Pseudomonas sp. GD04087]MDH1047852.1 deoxyribodipyrimidine photo-lyase [Pseudomonas sp. GD03903]MDH2003195.1 deoxyribodipyrimidine photo-lyase [Pseudomonas sp. GD03691]